MSERQGERGREGRRGEEGDREREKGKREMEEKEWGTLMREGQEGEGSGGNIRAKGRARKRKEEPYVDLGKEHIQNRDHRV